LGDYEWVVEGDLPKLPPESVLGLFLYQDDQHEIDALELSRWGDPNKPNGQFCLQPSTKDSIQRFDVTSRTATVRLSWRRDKARFTCWEGDDPTTTSRPVADWTYTGPKLFKPGREHVHINFWLMGGRPPASQQPQEVVIRSFSFRPAANGSGATVTTDRLKIASSKVYFPGGKEAKWVTRILNHSSALSRYADLTFRFPVSLEGVKVSRPEDIGGALSPNTGSRVVGNEITVRIPPIQPGGSAEVTVEAHFTELLQARVDAALVLKTEHGMTVDQATSKLEVGPGSFRTVHDPRWYERPAPVEKPKL